MHELRINRTVGVDPSFTTAYKEVSIAPLDHLMLLIALGHKGPDEIGIDAAPNDSSMSGSLKGVQFQKLTPASHFSFLGTCARNAGGILKSKGEERLCDLEDNAIRASVHQKAIAFFLKFFA